MSEEKKLKYFPDKSDEEVQAMVDELPTKTAPEFPCEPYSLPVYFTSEYSRLGVQVDKYQRLSCGVLINLATGVMHRDQDGAALCGSAAFYDFGKLDRLSAVNFRACRHCETRILGGLSDSS